MYPTQNHHESSCRCCFSNLETPARTRFSDMSTTQEALSSRASHIPALVIPADSARLRGAQPAQSPARRACSYGVPPGSRTWGIVARKACPYAKTWRPLWSPRGCRLQSPGACPGLCSWGLAAAGLPLEAAHGDDQARCAPGGEDGQVARAQPGAGRVRVVDGQQGVGEGVDGEDAADAGSQWVGRRRG